MSGHSKWSTIKRQKGVADIKRGQTFTKISNNISLAVKLGGSGDPDSNPRLRMALESAKAVNMPKENLQRAIDRGLGIGKSAFEEVVYEGYGPGQVAFIVEGATDNRLRTNQEVRSLFERNGGTMVGQGAVAHMFEKKGEIKAKSKGGDTEEETFELIDLGAEDIENYQEDDKTIYIVYTEPNILSEVGSKITQAGFTVESQDLIMKPTMTQTIDNKELAQKLIEFAERFEDHDDVQKVFSNLDIPEGLL